MISDNTICAISTAAGSGAIAVIRLSGKNAIEICDKVFRSTSKDKRLIDLPANTIHFGALEDDGELVDEVLVSLFKAPHSYTGEDVVEVSCHGAVFIQQKVLELFINNGACLAQPGEFTMRAFLNRKMDLSQAEGVADLIAASSDAAHKVALQQMRGGFSMEIKKLRDQLLNFISLIELELDFSEEDVEFADRTQLHELVEKIHSVASELISSFKLGNVIKHGIPVAIIGEPNVGKSTLLNALLNEEKALVTDIPGTTRDVIEDTINLSGITFRFIDTAGLRETQDKVESLGIERTHQKIEQASIVLQLVEAKEELEAVLTKSQELGLQLEGKHFIRVMNKSDELVETELAKKQTLLAKQNPSEKDRTVFISARDRVNLPVLKDLLLSAVDYSTLESSNVVVTNVRHFEALTNANQALERVLEGMDNGISGDFLAMDIRDSLHHLGEITGEITTDEILGNIFSKFCIGK